MQLHELKTTKKPQKKKRVGRGGKRGTYSGHGMKGQKSRAGARIRPGFRGGDNPLWKLFPKQRGASKKIEVKHARFRVANQEFKIVNLGKINDNFKDGEAVSPKVLAKRGLIVSTKGGVKILNNGDFNKKLKFSGLKFSKSAIAKLEKSGSSIVESKPN